MEKSMLITGGSSGIGLAIVKKFSEKNYQVFNLDNQMPQEVTRNTQWIACDVRKIDAIQAAVNKVMQITSRLDVVVANAGKHYSGTIEETSEEVFNEMMETNFKSVFFLLKATLPILKKQKNGNIILMGSDQCFVGKNNSAIYGATKGAIGQLTKSTALDYAAYNIRVNCICPGTIDTPLYQNVVEKYCARTGSDVNAIHRAEAAEQPLNRIGKPNEVANLAYFLSSDEAAFITGGLFPIDGGYTAK